MYEDKVNKSYISLLKSCVKKMKKNDKVNEIYFVLSNISLEYESDLRVQLQLDSRIKYDKQSISYFFMTMIGIIDYEIKNHPFDKFTIDTLSNRKNRILMRCKMIYEDDIIDEIFKNDELLSERINIVKAKIKSDDFIFLEAYELGYNYSEYINKEEVFELHDKLFDNLFEYISDNEDKRNYIKFKQKVKQLKK